VIKAILASDEKEMQVHTFTPSPFTYRETFVKIPMSPQGDYLYCPDSSMTSPILYIRETYAELKKVHWPGRNDVVKLTIIVLVISLIVGLYIGALDYIFVKATELLLR
jgi:preprotein translocase subunit SecE